MSQNSDKEASDDEYQDALSNPVIEKSSEDIIEEIIKKKGPLSNPVIEKSSEDIIEEIIKKRDPLSNPVIEKSSKDIIEEIIKRGKNITLDGADEANTATEESNEGAASNQQTGEKEEYETDDEEALIDMEKVLTEPEMKLRKEHAGELKEQGNEFFRNEETEKAIEIYSHALQICPTTHPKDRAILLSNRAAAKIKINAKEAAIKDCTKAITLWPEYVRAISRRAKLYYETDKLDEALADYELLYKLDPGNIEAKEAMVRLPPMIHERNEKMKAEVMGKLKDLGDLILKPFGLSTSSFQMQKDPATGGYSINLNQNKS